MAQYGYCISLFIQAIIFFLFLRVYTGGADKSDFDSMSSVLLIDEMGSKLRSTNDVKEIINHITTEHTIINSYLQKHVMLLPGDWGVWYNLKKLICTEANTLTTVAYVDCSSGWPVPCWLQCNHGHNPVVSLYP